MDLENKILSSPYIFTKSFMVDGDGCEWLITAPEGYIISLEFDHFNVNKKSEKSFWSWCPLNTNSFHSMTDPILFFNQK